MQISLMEGRTDGRTDGLTFSTLTQVEPENITKSIILQNMP